MKPKRRTVEQIIAKLRRADVELGKGKKVPEICKPLETMDERYYRCTSSRKSFELRRIPRTPKLMSFGTEPEEWSGRVEISAEPTVSC